MIKKIIHLADIHIPNSNEQRPYSLMLDTLIDDITKEISKFKEEGIERDEIRIVIVGDIFHQKIKASNESKTMFHKMLNALNNIAKTVIIAGNHDMLENNTDRIDSISPTFDINDAYKNIIYADKSLDYKSGCIEDDNVVWAIYSIFDKYAKPNLDKYVGSDKIIVGLYHGDIVGATTDSGRKSNEGINTDVFAQCKCVMAGHIHKFQCLRRKKVPIVYASSTFQQNSGENITNHGYVIWDMETTKFFFHEVPNDYKIYKFEITSYNDISNNKEKLLNQ